jgi:hypothetical protein
MINDYIINRNISDFIIIIIIISTTILMLTSTLEIVFYPNIAYSYTFNITNKLKQQQHQNSYQQNISQASIITINNQEKSFDNLNNNLTKVVILTFGDGYQSQFTLAKPVLDKYGYKGNFFVTCNKVGMANKMTWPDLVQL